VVEHSDLLIMMGLMLRPTPTYQSMLHCVEPAASNSFLRLFSLW